MASVKQFPLLCPEKLFFACQRPCLSTLKCQLKTASKCHLLSCLSLFTFNIGNEVNSMDPAQIVPTREV